MLNVTGMDETTVDLGQSLAGFAEIGVDQASVIDVVQRLADAAIHVETAIAKASLAAPLNGDHHPRLTIDRIAEQLFIETLLDAPVALIASAMQDQATLRDEAASLAVIIQPLDGWRHVDVNAPIGTVFSLLPIDGHDEMALLQPGRSQLAAGFIIYGPQTCLALTLGSGTDLYVLDRDERRFYRIKKAVEIPVDSHDYAIDAANYRHWDAPIQAYVDDNVAGVDGPRGRNFSMRWIASLVAEAYRILIRGGIYLSPGDRRDGFEKGCLRLIYEANPLAMMMEQAGGLATDGEDRILDIQPKALDQHVPLVFGSSAKVERVRAFHDGTLPFGERSPLFGRRGLFRH